MPGLWRFLGGLRALFRKAQVEHELNEELLDYLDQAVEQKMQAGMTREQALRAARLEMGNPEVVKEQVRDQGWESIAESVWRDVRYGVRMLGRNPGFTLVVVLTLTLGIGANSAIFSAVNAVLLKRYPFPQADRVLFLRQVTATNPGLLISIPNFEDYRRQQNSFRQLTLWRSASVNLTGGDHPERVVGSFVSDNFFDVLRVKAAQGRTFLPGEDKRSAEPVVVVSHQAWTMRFGGDPNLLGRRLMLNNESYTVVGILPPEFRASWLSSSDVYLPAEHSPAYHLDRNDPAMFVVGRLKDGITHQQALADIATIELRLAHDYPDAMSGMHVELTSVPEMEASESSAKPLLMLLAAVLILLLIACLNVATLLLARGSARRQELAVRSALGASRACLVRQLLTESLLVSVIGAALGLLLAFWLVWSFADLTPFDVPAQAALDWRVLLFTLSVAVFTGVVAGILPALRLSRMNPATALTTGTRTAGHAGHRLHSGFVVAQMALAIILLVGATLLVKSFRALLAIHPGFSGEQVLTMEYRLPRNKYPSGVEQWNFHRAMVEHVAQVPGVVSAAVVQALPLSGNWGEMPFTLPDRPQARPGEKPTALVTLITPDYFSTIGSPLLRGRDFTEHDGPEAPRVVIVTRSFAQKFWPGQDPIGREIQFQDSDVVSNEGANQIRRATIVGVAADVKQVHLRDPDRPLIYFPYSQTPAIFGTLVVRAAADPTGLTDAIRRAVWSVDKDQPVWRIRTVAMVLDEQVAPDRLMMWLVSSFGLLALALSVLGAYGLLSNSVNQRKQEIGVRMALGATPGSVLQWVLKQAVRLTFVGGLLGIAGGLVAARFMAGLLYGVAPADVTAFVLGWALMTLAALLASYLPARRASRVDPMVTLRYE
ncbi:MAG TPA: ABC transporter permease [Terriglobales bacterium]|jgi:putative ABC transport system permease protein|nr:ABC transporter permease [Terriglobales bacterium]